MPQSEEPEIDWQHVRQRVEAGKEPITQIARDLKISPNRLYKRKARWAASTAPKSKTAKFVKKTGAEPILNAVKPQTRKRQSANPGDMVQRLYFAADQQISNLEERLATGEAAFDEKEARILGTIARTLDKLMDLAQSGAQQKVKADEQQSDNASNGDIDSLRAELAGRLERLQSQR
ncbi:MAG: helix-turn-helix domain-containing protein [Cohaesibacter sp.]|jgi:hypothetical protein|nr:helix-turn-helix domain-containing protein [Cohaesibacter sp.]